MTDKKKTQRDQEDVKRARTDIKSACGPNEGNNPLIPPGSTNCDIPGEPVDPKAPKAADDASINPGTPVKASDTADYDAKVSKVDAKFEASGTQGVRGQRGKTKEDIAKDSQAAEDAKRADTDIKSACGPDGGNNPLVPPGGTNCDVPGEPADPKAPKAADDAGLNPGTPVKGGDTADYDAKVSKVDAKFEASGTQGVRGQRGKTKEDIAKDSQAAEDAKRADTDIKSACGPDGGNNPLVPPGGTNCDIPGEPADPKAPKAADDAGLNPGQAVRSSGMEDYDQKVSQMDGKYEDPNAQGRRGQRKQRRAQMAGKGSGRGPVAEGIYKLADQAPDSFNAEKRLAEAEARLQQLEDKIEPAFHQVWDRIKAMTPSLGHDETVENEATDEDLYQVDPQVLEKIAVKAAESVEGILGIHQGFLQDFASRFTDSNRGVQVRIEDNEVVVRLKLILDYDAERDQVFEELKEIMKQRIESATGLRLKAIQITIEDMMTAEEYRKLHS